MTRAAQMKIAAGIYGAILLLVWAALYDFSRPGFFYLLGYCGMQLLLIYGALYLVTRKNENWPRQRRAAVAFIAASVLVIFERWGTIVTGV